MGTRALTYVNAIRLRDYAASLPSYVGESPTARGAGLCNGAFS